MPLDAQALGKALAENLTLHSTLCRREAGAFQQAIRSGDDVVVACTQEKRLFGELGQQTEGAVSPIRFVNIRETGGWSKDAKAAMPKLAALLAAAKLPEAEPVATVTYKSAGRLLLIGPLEEAERFAAVLGDALDVTIFARGGSGAQERRYPVLGGRALLVTAVHREGLMQGTDLPLMEDVAESSRAPVIASGGIAAAEDLRALAHRGVSAAVLGMALYTGALDARAIAEEFDRWGGDA